MRCARSVGVRGGRITLARDIDRTTGRRPFGRRPRLARKPHRRHEGDQSADREQDDRDRKQPSEIRPDASVGRGVGTDAGLYSAAPDDEPRSTEPDKGASQRDGPRAVDQRPQNHWEGDRHPKGAEGQWGDPRDAAADESEQPVGQGSSSDGRLGPFAHDPGEVRAFDAAAFERLVAAVEAASDEDLFTAAGSSGSGRRRARLPSRGVRSRLYLVGLLAAAHQPPRRATSRGLHSR